ncbi:ZPR1 zinc-finger domain-containing protein [Lipomyces oligophaga]|uniref:ZPR1 zinc-finger domain-containing protein n=1 Tax=Lipomyces oligophaga TaxID=45792 RepID=UPI0034CDBB97
MSEKLFESVGEAVEQIAAVPDTTDHADDNTESEENGPVTDTAADEPQAVQEIESLCMNCEQNGTTRLLLTQIPYFREVVLMSFYCPHCGFRNSEIQPASEIQPKGAKYTFIVESKDDMDRQVVKSESCDVTFTDVALTIPHQRGQLTTIEGLLTEVSESLSQEQPARKLSQPEAYEKIEEFLSTLADLLKGNKFPFKVTADDPAGNSWIEMRPGEPHTKWSKTEYERTPEQNESLGLVNADAQTETETEAAEESVRNNDEEEQVTMSNDEIHTFQATCPSCLRRCDTHMKLIDIPHFKQVILMSTVCDFCGYKSNEVKTGGEIPEKGRRIKLIVDDPEDLARDILKSETCALYIPELNLDLTAGTLGGRFTTVEGLLREVSEQLDMRVFQDSSDSMTDEQKERWKKFLDGLNEAIEGKRKFTLILEDPLSASYLQNVYAPDPDPNMTIEEFDRTEEQNEDLGLADMHV